MVKRRPFWIALAIAILLAGNVYFFIDLWQRNIVVSVPDGDSLDLADGRRVRLLGIDAPEKGRCMADEARQKLVGLALARHVRLKEIVKDDFGRQLAIVIVDSVALQEHLLLSGLARNESSSGNPYNQLLKDVQEVAKAAKLGIWSDACRGKTSGKEDCTIKGNTRAGKKFYYTPSCTQYEQVVVDIAYGDAWFCSEKEAENAGFTRTSGCP